MSDLNTGTSANKAPSNQDDKIQWSANLFAPLLTPEQVATSEQTFQNEAAQRRTMLLILTKTPADLLQIAQDDPEAFIELLQVADNFHSRMQDVLEIATQAQARLYITAGQYADDMGVSE